MTTTPTTPAVPTASVDSPKRSSWSAARTVLVVAGLAMIVAPVVICGPRGRRQPAAASAGRR